MGARDAKHAGASRDDIACLGGWGQAESLEGAYLTELPIKIMSVMSGFQHRPGSYYLERATQSSPPDLLDTIFPFAKKVKIAESYYGSELSRAGFCKLMDFLKIVLLQDAVLMTQNVSAYF